MEGALITFCFPQEVKFRFTVNIMCHVVKNWWGLVIQPLSTTKHEDITWDQFNALFREEYVP